MQGVYRGTYRHEPDIDAVIQRALQGGIRHIMITAGTIEESRTAIRQVREWNHRYNNTDSSRSIRFSCTVGVHPTRCAQVFEPDTVEDDRSDHTTITPANHADASLKELYDLCVDGMKDGTVVAYGEIGLDYDRLEFCSKEIQQQY
jgi:TatD DNase family protein